MEYQKIQTNRNPEAQQKERKSYEFLNKDFASNNLEQSSTNTSSELTKKKLQREEMRKNAVVERLIVATNQTSSAVTESIANVNDLQAAVQEMSSAAQEASTAANQSLKAVIEIENATNTSSEKSVYLANIINNLKGLVQNSNEDINTMIEGVKIASEVSVESSKNVKELERLAEEIGKTVQAIIEVADQTNLLALNAAIEAARAGKHGRGFAVVADEVRTLAEITNKSAMDIQNIIGDVRTDVNSVVEDISKVGDMAVSEVEQAKAVTEQLSKISTDFIRLLKEMDEVQNYQKSVALAATEIKGASNQILLASQDSASATEESNASLIEQTKALNEIGNASVELADMAEEIKVISVTQKNSEELAAAAGEISSMVEEANKSSLQILKALEQISAAAEEQSSACEEGQKSAQQVEVQIKTISDKLEFMSKNSAELQNLLQINKDSVDNLVREIQRSAEQNKLSAENVKKLERSMRKIDKTIDAINNVTTKIDLLSLNGSIEAARSGKYGKGFAVVAGDIKQLAKQSAESVENIKDMIKDINDQIFTVTEDVEEAVRVSLQEVEKGKKTTKVLIDIKKDMDNVLVVEDELSVMAEKNINSIKEVVTGVTQISKGAEQASEAAQNASIRSQEQTKALSQIATASGEIASLADELRSF